MKIQCDVCSKEEASVFCCADDAALCITCDHRVHRANKLASKHRRYSLLLPSAAASNGKPDPLCDICQEKQGFMFCKEDRAILCTDCDAPIHSANTLTMKHSRFLLTGTRLSSVAAVASSLPPEEVEGTSTIKPNQILTGVLDKPAINSNTVTADNTNSSTGSGNNIAEYLIKMLPGWRVEDILVDDAAVAFAVANGNCKTNEIPPFQDADMECGSTIEFPIWFPYVPEIPQLHQPTGTVLGGSVDHSCSGQWNEDIFAVPQVGSVSGSNKRPRSSSVWYY